MLKRMKNKRPEQRRHGQCLLLGLAAAVSSALSSTAWAQAEGGGGARTGWYLVPRLSVTETYTDNLKLSSSGQDAALITNISPGISISSNSGRLRGSLDYALNGLIYSKTQQAGQVQNALSARATLDAWENRLFLDAQASVSRQTISAFGQSSNDSSLANGNSTEVASLSMSPYLRGQLAGLARYELRGTVSETRTKDSLLGDASNRSGSLQLVGLRGGSLLNWSASLSKQSSHAKTGRETGNSSGTASLLIRPDFEWGAGLVVGRERNDYTTLSQQTSTTYGLNANWTPTPRTKFALDWTHHNYGNAHSLSFEHRMARSVWRYSDSQSLNTGGAQNSAGLQTNYELFFIQFATIEPDPVLRDVLVRAFLRNLGLSPNAWANSGFLSASNSLSRNRQFSFSLQGLRTTMTLMANRSQNSRLAIDPLLGDDLSKAGRVQQRVYAINVAHQLTPTDTVNIALTQQRSSGDLANQGNDLKSLTANWSARLGARTSLQLGLRHNRFNAQLLSYRENAAIATLVQQF